MGRDWDLISGYFCTSPGRGVGSGWVLAVNLGAGVLRGLGVPVCRWMISLGDLWCSFF